MPNLSVTDTCYLAQVPARYVEILSDTETLSDISLPWESFAVHPGSSNLVPAFIVISESPFSVMVGAMPSLYSIITFVQRVLLPDESLTV